MIETFCEKLIQELGATGLLLLGLCWIMWNPLRTIAKHVTVLNGELGEIRDLLKDLIHKGD